MGPDDKGRVDRPCAYYTSAINLDRCKDDGADRLTRGALLDPRTVFFGALQVLDPPGGASSSSKKSIWDRLPEELVALLQEVDPVVIAWSVDDEELFLVVSCALRLPGH